MIDASVKLIEKAIDLIRERERRRHTLYKEYVFPLMEHFEVVHAGYMQSAGQYRADIAAAGSSFHSGLPLFANIAQDARISGTARIKLMTMLRDLSSERGKGKLFEFLYTIDGYFGYAIGDDVPNVPRFDLLHDLQDVAHRGADVRKAPFLVQSQDRSVLALDVVDKWVDRLQEAYQVVHHSHMALKRHLLR